MIKAAGFLTACRFLFSDKFQKANFIKFTVVFFVNFQYNIIINKIFLKREDYYGYKQYLYRCKNQKQA